MGHCISSSKKIYPIDKPTPQKKILRIITNDKVAYYPQKKTKIIFKSK